MKLETRRSAPLSTCPAASLATGSHDCLPLLVFPPQVPALSLSQGVHSELIPCWRHSPPQPARVGGEDEGRAPFLSPNQ